MAQFCKEAQSFLIDGRFPDLANLLLTSADLVLANASEKGIPRRKLEGFVWLMAEL